MAENLARTGDLVFSEPCLHPRRPCAGIPRRTNACASATLKAEQAGTPSGRRAAARTRSLWDMLSRQLALTRGLDARAFFSDPARYRGIAAERARAIADTHEQAVLRRCARSWPPDGHDPHPRFRRPEHPAHRPQDPAARRLQRDRAAGTPAGRRSTSPACKGIILSGSPYSVYETGRAGGRPRASTRRGFPSSGSATGCSASRADHGGTVASLGRKEYGRARVTLDERTPLFRTGPSGSFVSWMSHGDSRHRCRRRDSVSSARSDNGLPAAFVNEERRIWGVQFHPEASHCEYGMEVLEAFAIDICGAAARVEHAAHFSTTRGSSCRGGSGTATVVLLISGGVDSCVVAALLLKSLPPDQVHLMYIDTGLMRPERVRGGAARASAAWARATCTPSMPRERFYAGLAGVEDPEQKRRIIGDLFIRIAGGGDREAGHPGRLPRPGNPLHGPHRVGKGRGQQGQPHQDPPQRALSPGRGKAGEGPHHRAAQLAVQGRGAGAGPRARPLAAASSAATPFPARALPCGSWAR